MIGVIKLVNSSGMGFISKDKIDYFFHYTDYQGDWKKLVAQWLVSEETPIGVEFDHDRDSRRGPKAKNVKLVNQEMTT